MVNLRLKEWWSSYSSSEWRRRISQASEVRHTESDCYARCGFVVERVARPATPTVMSAAIANRRRDRRRGTPGGALHNIEQNLWRTTLVGVHCALGLREDLRRGVEHWDNVHETSLAIRPRTMRSTSSPPLVHQWLPISSRRLHSDRGNGSSTSDVERVWLRDLRRKRPVIASPGWVRTPVCWLLPDR